MILICKQIIPEGYSGLTLYPFIFLKEACQKNNAILLNHEQIHLAQQKELFIVFFYALYVIEFLIRLVVYKNWSTAYRNISFEREAYGNEANLVYIKKRPRWAFFNFI
ncbi:MAG: hypothetical protein ACPG45_08275 [Flavobacteriaceae bacterium]